MNRPAPDLRPEDTAAAAGLTPTLGVVIVCFNSGDVILDCLESLLAASGVRLHIVVVDNASTDDSVDRMRRWASEPGFYSVPPDLPFALPISGRPIALVESAKTCAVPAAPQVLLLHAGVNGGYAGGVNAGLAALAATPGVDRFWILNPDSVVPPGTPRAFALAGGNDARFSLMGGRVNYLERPDVIQIDGGVIDWRTGVTRNINQGASARSAPHPDPAAIDFISGASMVASRRFYEAAGPMAEDYFLYYEEVDWAMQRGELPLSYCRDAVVFHRAGTSIGSTRPGHVGSPLSIYFKHRNRLRFLKRYRPSAVATAHVFTLAKAVQVLLKGHPREAGLLVAASFGAAPPSDVRDRLSPAAAARAFGS